MVEDALLSVMVSMWSELMKPGWDIVRLCIHVGILSVLVRGRWDVFYWCVG